VGGSSSQIGDAMGIATLEVRMACGKELDDGDGEGEQVEEVKVAMME